MAKGGLRREEVNEVNMYLIDMSLKNCLTITHYLFIYSLCYGEKAIIKCNAVFVFLSQFC